MHGGISWYDTLFSIIISTNLINDLSDTMGLDQESEIPSPRELGSRSSGASNKEA
ncbi:uncharacterized protein DS421_10g294070 [Arachis hypogaea]|nr:uncharacterized protein DS421_10g294070 [Arachis hypogaea]